MSGDELVPPHSIEAEQSVVCACLLGGVDVVATLVDILSPTDCYSPDHTEMLRACWHLFETNEAIDSITVIRRLRETGRLDQVGGSPAIVQLMKADPSLANYERHARLVVTLARVRSVASVCRRIAAESTSDFGDASEWLVGAESRVYEAARIDDYQASSVDIVDVVRAEQKAATERSDEDPETRLGVTTGLADVDRALGSLKLGYKYALGGFPGAGKTALAIQIAVHVASSGGGVAFASQEMTRVELVQRAISQYARVNNRSIERRDYKSNELELVTLAWSHLAKLPIKIDDRSAFSVASLRAWLRRVCSQFAATNVPLRLLVLDHMHLLKTRSGRHDESDIAELSNGVREIAKDFGIAVLELHPFNRATYDQKRPTMRSFKGSSAIEHDAYGVMAVHREDLQRMDRQDHTGAAELLLLKVRGGGETGMVNLHFTDKCTRFDSVERNSCPYRDDGFSEYDNGRF